MWRISEIEKRLVVDFKNIYQVNKLYQNYNLLLSYLCSSEEAIDILKDGFKTAQDVYKFVNYIKNYLLIPIKNDNDVVDLSVHNIRSFLYDRGVDMKSEGPLLRFFFDKNSIEELTHGEALSFMRMTHRKLTMSVIELQHKVGNQ